METLRATQRHQQSGGGVVDEAGLADSASLMETMKKVKGVLDGNARELNDQVAQLHATQLLTKRFEALLLQGGLGAQGGGGGGQGGIRFTAVGDCSSSTGSGPTSSDIEELEAQVNNASASHPPFVCCFGSAAPLCCV
jgi:hypothetical protein